MAAFAKEYAAKQPVAHAAASANQTHITRNDGKVSNRDRFAAAVEHMLK